MLYNRKKPLYQKSIQYKGHVANLVIQLEYKYVGESK